ncbi:MAG: imidazolonepropionase [Candidatus Dormibacteria bacterium]
MTTRLARIGRLYTANQPVLENVDVVIGADRIVAVGQSGTSSAASDAEVFDCQGALLTAGLIDAHTHPVYAHPRLSEISERSEGAGYTEIAARGGGISATVRATRAEAWDTLEERLRVRLRHWLVGGTTTVEAKTGYWLEREGELLALRLLHKLACDASLPELVVTFLGAHALPDEYRDRRQEYVSEAASWSRDAAAAGADFADVFCDQDAFTAAESAQLLGAAREAGLKLRLHADELALTGGTRLAVQLGAVSADHLLKIGPEEIAVLAGSCTVATLCPVTALAMGQSPPARQLLAAGVPVALGSDHNPGTSGTTSMSLIVWLAVTELGLSVEQALSAATLGGSLSLGLSDRGRVAAGQRADLVLWDADHEGGFGWNPNLRPLQVWRAGRLVESD